jgi:hypothetical protein
MGSYQLVLSFPASAYSADAFVQPAIALNILLSLSVSAELADTPV